MDTPVKRFSSGMISRLSFAIAMQFPADIYVFDEVLAVVDAEFQAAAWRRSAAFTTAGRTVIFVSHHRDQVAEVCERRDVARGGSRCADIGPTADCARGLRARKRSIRGVSSPRRAPSRFSPGDGPEVFPSIVEPRLDVERIPDEEPDRSSMALSP